MASLPVSESESTYFGADRSFEKIEITAYFWSDGWGTPVFSSSGVYESIERDAERDGDAAPVTVSGREALG